MTNLSNNKTFSNEGREGAKEIVNTTKKLLKGDKKSRFASAIRQIQARNAKAEKERNDEGCSSTDKKKGRRGEWGDQKGKLYKSKGTVTRKAANKESRRKAKLAIKKALGDKEAFGESLDPRHTPGTKPHRKNQQKIRRDIRRWLHGTAKRYKHATKDKQEEGYVSSHKIRKLSPKEQAQLDKVIARRKAREKAKKVTKARMGDVEHSVRMGELQAGKPASKPQRFHDPQRVRSMSVVRDALKRRR